MDGLNKLGKVAPVPQREDPLCAGEAVEEEPVPPLGRLPVDTSSQRPWQPCEAVGRLDQK